MSLERKSGLKNCFLGAGLFFLTLIFGILIAIFSMLTAVFKPLDSVFEIVDFEVEAGDTILEVATRLKDQEIIRSEFWFGILGRVSGTTLTAGSYELSSSQSSWEIVQILKIGKPKIQEVKVTFLEGWRIEEIVRKLIEVGLVQESSDFFRQLVATDSVISQEDKEKNPYLRGELFPDTYNFTINTSVADIIAIMQSNFSKRISGLDLDYEQLIVASIVEREALFDEDRAQIAGVYFNRIKAGMKLDADPTVQFGKVSLAYAGCTAEGFKLGSGNCADINWWPEIFRSDYLGVDSPYNTYLNLLPPTPIANPGLSSIKASINPADHNYFYFVTDLEGRAHFATTLAEHQANIAEFR